VALEKKIDLFVAIEKLEYGERSTATQGGWPMNGCRTRNGCNNMSVMRSV